MSERSQQVPRSALDTRRRGASQGGCRHTRHRRAAATRGGQRRSSDHRCPGAAVSPPPWLRVARRHVPPWQRRFAHRGPQAHRSGPARTNARSRHRRDITRAPTLDRLGEHRGEIATDTPRVAVAVEGDKVLGRRDLPGAYVGDDRLRCPSGFIIALDCHVGDVTALVCRLGGPLGALDASRNYPRTADRSSTERKTSTDRGTPHRPGASHRYPAFPDARLRVIRTLYSDTSALCRLAFDDC